MALFNRYTGIGEDEASIPQSTVNEAFTDWLDSITASKRASDKIYDKYSDIGKYYDLIDEIYKKYGESAARSLVEELGIKGFDWDHYKSNIGTDYDFGEYLEGLFTSSGAEAEANRIFNSAQAVENRTFQHNEAKIQRDWYEYMSNSAYQRSVADMKAAGINPILAYSQGGAAVSGTGVPTGSAAYVNGANGDSISTVLNAAANVISAVSGSSAKKIDSALKLIKFFS